MPRTCGMLWWLSSTIISGVLRQVVEQRRRRLAGLPPREVARVVLDAVAVADLAQHLQVEQRALVEPLRLEQLALLLQLRLADDQLRLDRLDRVVEAWPRRHVVAGRIDGDLGQPADRLARQRVEGGELLDLVAEQLDAHAGLLVRGHDLDHVAAHPEGAALELVVVAVVARVHQLGQDLAPVQRVALAQEQQHPVVRLRRAQAVDARHRGHDDHVAPLEEAAGGGQPHPVDLVVDRRFLLDVGVGLRDVRLRLVVVVIGDEVLDRVVREEGLELLVELGGQGLVVGEHQRGPVHARDGRGHAEGLAAAGHAQQHLVLVPALQPGRAAPRWQWAGRPWARTRSSARSGCRRRWAPAASPPSAGARGLPSGWRASVNHKAPTPGRPCGFL